MLDKQPEALSALLAIDEWRFASWAASEHPETISSHRGSANPDWRGELAFAKLGALEIELIQDVAGPSTYAESARRSPLGLRHIMFMVNDVAKAVRFAADSGVGVSTQTATTEGELTWAVLDTFDRFGFDIELKKIYIE